MTNCERCGKRIPGANSRLCLMCAHEPKPVAPDPDGTITIRTVEETPAHETMRVFVNGASAGLLTFRTGEAAWFKRALRSLAAGDALHAAAVAAVAYDDAIQACANDPDRMSSYCSAEGDDLDTLYAAWINASRTALAKVAP